VPLKRWLLAALALTGGCSSDAAVRAEGDACFVATDCPDPLACVFAKCRRQCAGDRDCPSGQYCTGVVAPRAGVCMLDSEGKCSLHSDCPDGLACSARGRCEAECVDDRDCLESQACRQGTCLDRALAPETSVPDSGAVGATCARNSDCLAPLVCLGARCALECLGDRDCRGGMVCRLEDHTCRAPGGVDAGVDGTADSATDGSLDGASDGTVDGSDTDGGTDAGAGCAKDFDCDDGNFCNGVEKCVGGACASAPEGPCASHVACIVDTCDEATKKCTHTPTAELDADGDGRLSLVCGGDDCDDKDKSVFVGAPELCNGKDDNCNGLVDEGARVPRSKLLTSVVPIGSTNSGAIAAVDGKAWVLTDSAPSYSYAYRIGAEVFDDKGVSTGSKTIFTGAVDNSGRLLALAGGSGRALLVHEFGAERRATQIEADLTIKIPKVTLTTVGAYSPAVAGGSAVWTGTRWLVVWAQQPVGPPVAKYAFLGTDGVLGVTSTLPTADAGAIDGQRLQAVLSGTTVAVLHGDSTSKVRLTLLDGATGASIGVVRVSTPDGPATGEQLFAAPGGFRVLWKEASFPSLMTTFVSTSGVVGAAKALVDHPSSRVYAGAHDGDGVLLLRFHPYPSAPVGAYEMSFATKVDGVWDNTLLTTGGGYPGAETGSPGASFFMTALVLAPGRYGLFWIGPATAAPGVYGMMAGCP